MWQMKQVGPAEGEMCKKNEFHLEEMGAQNEQLNHMTS